MKTKEQNNEYMRGYYARSDRAYLLNKFQKIRSRCYNSNDKEYHCYGGRGIAICDEWLASKDRFVEWALFSGFKRDLQIDRIDNDRSYGPENCQWVDSRQNNRNRSNNKLDVAKVAEIRELIEQGLSNSQIAPKFGVHRSLIYRIRKNQQWL